VTAVDADPAMVAAAAGLVPGATVQVAALPVLPFDDAQFDAVLANFVINHVGRPRSALAELGRVTAPGGRVAMTIWPQPPSPAVGLLTQAVRDCGADRRYIRLAPQDDFPRTEPGLRGLVEAAGLRDATCRSVHWEFVVPEADWWHVASGVSWMRDFSAEQSPQLLDRVRDRFEQLSREFSSSDGNLALPVTALLATGQATRRSPG
jgi:SAM-dependent methyltransferase